MFAVSVALVTRVVVPVVDYFGAVTIPFAADAPFAFSRASAWWDLPRRWDAGWYVLFPIFVWLAIVVGGRWFAVLASCFGVGQSVVAISFYTWRHIFEADARNGRRRSI
jgi:hypothetical protein